MLITDSQGGEPDLSNAKTRSSRNENLDAKFRAFELVSLLTFAVNTQTPECIDIDRVCWPTRKRRKKKLLKHKKKIENSREKLVRIFPQKSFLRSCLAVLVAMVNRE